MKNNKYKILILSDLKESAESELKSTISLAKMIDAEIMLFHVKKPVDIVKRESQLSAMRVLNKEHVLTRKKIENLLKPINKSYGLNVAYKLGVGNLKDQINEYMSQYKPDIVVLGKKRMNAFSVLGDRITDFVLKKHNGPVMIAGKHMLNPNDKLSLGILNSTNQVTNLDFVQRLVGNTDQPVKSFKVSKSKKPSVADNSLSTNKKTVEYVFDNFDSIKDSIGKYASKSNVNLMCVDKADISVKSINKLNISIFLTGKHQPILQN